ncbi:MAG: Nif3-like dinuclear metal center hexameric protein [Clostridiales bacterium]|nr:Nif3-like dinuclear metal center hexameric protein [Clostridiales bacterium]
MKIMDILGILEDIAPLDLQVTEPFSDNCGLIIGREYMDVRKIMVSVDVTKRAVETAIRECVDLIITHHPPIFIPIKKINDDLLIDLIENSIAVISLHTNYDCARLNDILAQRLGIIRTEGILEEKSMSAKSSHLGRIGIFDEELSGEDVIQRVKEELGIETVRVIGDVRDSVVSAAVCQGASGGFEAEIKELDVDVFITGEVKYNNAVELSNTGCFVIEAGHYETEKLFISDLVELLAFRTPELEIMPFYDRVVTTI